MLKKLYNLLHHDKQSKFSLHFAWLPGYMQIDLFLQFYQTLN